MIVDQQYFSRQTVKRVYYNFSIFSCYIMLMPLGLGDRKKKKLQGMYNIPFEILNGARGTQWRHFYLFPVIVIFIVVIVVVGRLHRKLYYSIHNYCQGTRLKNRTILHDTGRVRAPILNIYIMLFTRTCTHLTHTNTPLLNRSSSSPPRRCVSESILYGACARASLCVRVRARLEKMLKLILAQT